MSVYRHISGAKKAKGLSVSLQCELLDVSESGYWAWVGRAPSDRALYDAWLTERIQAIHAASKGRYGSPRVHAMLRREGVRVGEKRVARVMRQAGIQGAYRRRKKGCTTGVAGVEPFADLVGRKFRPEAPDRVWCMDIKQTMTGEGWLYLAAVQDLFSRRIVGWAMAGHMREELVVEALQMAVRQRRPAHGTIHHSDHGGQPELNRSSQQVWATTVQIVEDERLGRGDPAARQLTRGCRRAGSPGGRAVAATAARAARPGPPPGEGAWSRLVRGVCLASGHAESAGSSSARRRRGPV